MPLRSILFQNFIKFSLWWFHTHPALKYGMAVTTHPQQISPPLILHFTHARQKPQNRLQLANYQHNYNSNYYYYHFTALWILSGTTQVSTRQYKQWKHSQ